MFYDVVTQKIYCDETVDFFKGFTVLQLV